MKILISEQQSNILKEQSSEDIVNIVIKGFKLVPAPEGFGTPYTTQTNKPSKSLAHIMNIWIKKKFPFTDVRIGFEENYKTFNFYKKS